MPTIRRLPQSDVRLGRHVEHDARSRWYAYRRSLPIETVAHISNIGVFDQGNLGSCTGNAAVGCLGYPPFHASLPWYESGLELNQALAVAVYSDATRVDAFPGEYPPTDTGSSGLAVAKVLKTRGLIAGYLHAFSVIDVLGALMERPLIVGTNWYQSMSDPDSAGFVRIAGPVVGGHEYILDGYEKLTGTLSFRNSWGQWWGLAGRFYMSVDTLTRLLDEEGDATVFVPLTDDSPEPVEPTPAPQGCLTSLLGR